MEKHTLTWMELNYMQALDVVRTASSLTAAVSGDDGPYVAEMYFQLEMNGVQPVIHLSTSGEGRIAHCLQALPRMALLFRREHCTGTDVVLAEGTAAITNAEHGLRLRVPVQTLSARRFFLPQPTGN